MDTEEMQKLKKEIVKNTERDILMKKWKILNGTVTSVKMEKNYALRGKWSHLKTKKHERNYYEANPLIKL